MEARSYGFCYAIHDQLHEGDRIEGGFPSECRREAKGAAVWSDQSQSVSDFVFQEAQEEKAAQEAEQAGMMEPQQMLYIQDQVRFFLLPDKTCAGFANIIIREWACRVVWVCRCLGKWVSDLAVKCGEGPAQVALMLRAFAGGAGYGMGGMQGGYDQNQYAGQMGYGAGMGY